MRKSIVLMLIATLILGALMVSCNSDVSEGTNGGDKLVEVTISGGSTSKGISAVGSMEDADAYYWYYKAGKNDSSVYRTGQTVAVSNGVLGEGGWKPVKTQNNEVVAGLTNANLGFFSTGDWLFSFVAYKKAATFNGDSATNGNDTLVPVYYQYNLAVEVSSNTIASSNDQKVYITVTPNVGQAQGDAEFVFPEAGLTWKYVNDTSADAQYTLAALNDKKAYMYVYYKDNSVANDTEHLLARSDEATITSDTTNKESNGTFTGFKGVGTNSAFTKDPVTISSTYSGKNYTLYFRVVLSSNSEEIGSTNTQSVTAYTGGKITISSTGTASISDNEVQYQVEIKEVDAVITSSANGVTTSAATVVAAAVPTEEPTVLNSSTETDSVAQVITSSNISSSEKSAEKKSSVSIPEGALQSTTMTLTEKTGSGTDETKTVTVVETSYKVEDTKDTSATISPPSNFTVTSGNTVVSKLSYTMIATKTTTTTKTVGGTLTEKTSNAESYSVTNFATENNNTTTYYVITDYLDTDLEDVVVKYDGTGDDVVFSTTGTPDSARVDNTNSTNYTGYDPNTGLLIFKTSHFSDFYVTAKQTVVAENTTTGKKYYSLERAIARVEDGQTIKLLASVNLGSNRITLSGDKSITFDLGTYTLTCGTNNHGFDINGAELTVKNGNIDGNGIQVFNVYGSATDTNGKYSVLTINDNVQITNAGHAICVFGTTASANNGYDTEVNLYGSIAGTHGVFVSGNLANASNTPEANDAMIVSNVININSGSSISATDQAIAMNGGATVNVADGATLIGSEAIGLKRGTLKVTGGTLRATGDYAVPMANNNGTEASGSVVSITSTYNYARGIVANITGGTFVSAKGHALSIQKTGTTQFSVNALAVTVSGGTFTAGSNAEAKAVYAAEGTVTAFLTGGTYNTNPSAYVADGYCAKSNQDGTWTVWLANCTHPDSSHVSYIVNSTDKTKHDVICGYCGEVIGSELHEYDSEDTHKCIKCSYESITYHVYPDATSPTFSLSDAIVAYNSNNNPDINYIIELEPGIYNVPVGTYIIEQTKVNAGSTLTIKAKDMETATQNWNVILRPTDVPKDVKDTVNSFFFSVSGGSSYSNGGSILFEGLTFDMSDSEYAKDSYSKVRLFGVYCSSGYDSRYAHDITINNCNFIGCGGKFASAVGANNSNSSPSGITVSNCIGDKLNCWFNGYVGNGAGFGLNFKNLSSNNFLCLLNNQSSAPTITIDNVDGSFFYALNNGEFSTEYAVVYTIGGTLDIRNCEWELVAKPNNRKTGPAFVNTNGKPLSDNLTITTSDNAFTNNTGVTLSGVYITNRNSKQLLINGSSKTENGSYSF